MIERRPSLQNRQRVEIGSPGEAQPCITRSLSTLSSAAMTSWTGRAPVGGDRPDPVVRIHRVVRHSGGVIADPGQPRRSRNRPGIGRAHGPRRCAAWFTTSCRNTSQLDPPSTARPRLRHEQTEHRSYDGVHSTRTMMPPHRYGVSGTRPLMRNAILDLSLHKGYKSKITTVPREQQAQKGRRAITSGSSSSLGDERSRPR